MNNFFRGKNILITGGCGSLGRELTKQLLNMGENAPFKIVIYNRDDHKQKQMDKDFNYNKKLRFIIGDVCDYDSMYLALHNNIDYVIHAAALKHVEKSFYNPLAYKKNIVDGAENIVKACINTNVKSLVALSTDKACLYGNALIDIGNNKTEKLNKIVNFKKSITIPTYNESTKQITSSKITNWYTNSLNNRELYFVTYKYNRKYGKKTTGFIATGDHPVLTNNGWKRIDNININKDKLITKETYPTEKQKAIIYGTIMGDSYIRKPIEYRNDKKLDNINLRTSIIVSHSPDQKNWLELKYNALKSIGLYNITKHDKIINNKTYSMLTFYSESSAYFAELRQKFYVDDIKIIPKKLISKILKTEPELFLATLIQDDGYKSDNNIRIATHNFNKDDVIWFINELNELGIESYIYHPKYKNSIYNEIRLTVKGTKQLCKLISKYMLLDYKLPFKYETFDESLWDLGESERYYGTPIIKYVDPDILLPKKVMCIDIENTHNFIVANMIVHNCSPINTYGKCKSLSDDIFINGNIYNQTKFLVIRYGNVINSNGSVLKVNNDNTDIPLYGNDMTRFWLTVEYAAKLTLYLLEHGKGGELLIPKIPTIPVKSLLQIKFPNANLINTKQRAGEKKHEIMISIDDYLQTVEYNNFYIMYPYSDVHYSFDNELGFAVKDRFSYSSDNNPWVITEPKDIKSIIDGNMPIVPTTIFS